jgi:uncharacterized cofD-like protein
MELTRPKVVVIGGGTGNFTVLRALRGCGFDLTAIVAMADDGGSTGVLRDELGVLPAGDVRQCLTALSESPKMRELFEYRFQDGTLGGHSVGNLLLTALEKMSGSFASAVETASEVLNIEGKVVPATLENVRLKMSWPREKMELSGEAIIDAAQFAFDPKTSVISLEPSPHANPDAISAIKEADLVIIAPGDIYTSLAPTLVIDEIGRVLSESLAKKLLVCNLVTKRGQTDNFTAQDHAAELERLAGHKLIDAILYNNAEPSPEVLAKYLQEGAARVEPGATEGSAYELIGADLLGQMALASAGKEAAAVTRSLIRHDNHKLRQATVVYAKRTD